MRLERVWAEPVDLPDAWQEPPRLGRMPLLAYWSHPVHFPCDESGFRIPAAHASVEAQYAAAEGGRRVFCLGGSGTFGWYLPVDAAYPHALDGILPDGAALNFGLGAVDTSGTLRIFVELLRRELVPDDVVFLNGANEKQGFLQATHGAADFAETDLQYYYFRGWYEGGVRRRRWWPPHRNGARPEDPGDPLRFVEEQCRQYLRAQATIVRIAQAWGIRAHFFLLPTVWDVWPNTTSRHAYNRALFDRIVAQAPAVVDLTGTVPLEPDMFIDWAHPDRRGNALLAAAIAERI